MKLLTKTSLWYLCVAALALLAGGCFFYVRLNALMIEEVDEDLSAEKKRIEKYLGERTALPQDFMPTESAPEFKPVTTPEIEKFYDTELVVPEEDNERLPYRVLVFPAQVGGQHYAVSIRKPLFEAEDLVDTIAQPLLILAGALLLALALLNAWLFRRLWNPFYKTLQQLKRFEVHKGEKFSPGKTSTAEFAELNNTLRAMTEKISSDFASLKAFTENAAHELQTPLAIIRSKTELLLQSGKLDEEQLRIVQQVFEAAHRLAKTNQALLLLAKIENRQFAAEAGAKLSALLREKIGQWQELLEAKELHFHFDLLQEPEMKLHPYLAEVLLSNLLGNAIRHTETGGELRVIFTADHIEFRNTGRPLKLPAEKLFERFQKENPESESPGLGLAIVKSIAEAAGLEAYYFHDKSEHVFGLKKSKNQNLSRK